MLVDKPLNIPLRASIDLEAARGIWGDYVDLMKISKANPRLLFMMATQKRYSSLFTQIAERVRKVSQAVSGAPITSINYETNDGYWITDYTGKRFSYSPDYCGGGKVSHSGYHLLDIIPWLMRQSGMRDIDNAIVTASFERPDAAWEALPQFRNHGNTGEYEQEGVENDDGNINVRPSSALSEINAWIKISFRCKQTARCVAVITMLHEGVSSQNGRVKMIRIKRSFT